MPLRLAELLPPVDTAKEQAAVNAANDALKPRRPVPVPSRPEPQP